MRMKLNFRIVVFIAAILFGLFYSAPSILQTEAGKKITLGLDLQGGLHMLLGVKTEEAVTSKLKSLAASVKHFAEREEILVDDIKPTATELTFVILDSDDTAKIQDFLNIVKIQKF